MVTMGQSEPDAVGSIEPVIDVDLSAAWSLSCYKLGAKRWEPKCINTEEAGGWENKGRALIHKELSVQWNQAAKIPRNTK